MAPLTHKIIRVIIRVIPYEYANKLRGKIVASEMSTLLLKKFDPPKWQLSLNA